MKGSQVPASAYLVAWWCEPWLRVVRCVRVWCVCGGFGAAVVEMPKGATSDRWVYIHMHAAGSVASWQFQPSPLLFSSCACPAAHSHLHRHPCSSPLLPPPLLLPPPKLPPLLLPPPFRIAFDTTDTCLLLLPSMRQHGESCQLARRVVWVRQSLSEPSHER